LGAVSGLARSSEPQPEKPQFVLLSMFDSYVRWAPKKRGQAPLLRYAIAEREISTPNAANCQGVRPPVSLMQASAVAELTFRQSLRTAFARWADAANISFVEVARADEADIVIGEQTAPRGHAFTNVALGQSNGSTFRPIVKSLICLNPEAHWKVGFDGNLNSYDLVHTFTHEIGHAIGLDHPGARGHVMSFSYEETHAGLSDGDILGAVRLYGWRTPADAVRHIVSVNAERATVAAKSLTLTSGHPPPGNSK